MMNGYTKMSDPDNEILFSYKRSEILIHATTDINLDKVY